ncbi:DMT family transporter [Leeia oryzae]|uniref:DMT family transporter n=1 Tax=Leeia oryzae TaxID=356662 RepID=UPI000378FF2B|nr:DMT family transporter [Leeia oryzae]
MKSSNLLPLLALHLAVLLFGTAGTFGKALAVTPMILVFGRTLFAALALTPVVYAQKQLSFKAVPVSVILCGMLLAIHWLTFFASVSAASVAVGLMGFASFPIFVAWLEPIVFKEKRHAGDWWAALAVAFGMWLMLRGAEWSAGSIAGLLWGIASGFSFALLALVNRWQGSKMGAFRLAWLQNMVACLCLAPFVSWPLTLSTQTWLGLIVLGIVFTALSHGMFMFSLQRISARLASLTATLEPVYGIVLAWLWLHETPSLQAIAGCVIIIGATSIATICKTST